MTSSTRVSDMMLWPLPATLECLTPHLSDTLLPAATLSAVHTLARVLPQAMSGYFFECHLGSGTKRADFLACVIAARGGRDILARPAALLAASLPDPAVWRRVQRFCTDWADPASPLCAQVPLVWLEFDMHDAPHLSAPSVLLCLDPAFLGRHAGAAPDASLTAERYRQLTTTAGALLLEEALAPRTVQTLWSCFDNLPPGGRMLHMSVMLARQPRTVKLNVSVPTARLLAYLDDIGWSGARQGLAALLATFCPALPTVQVDVTVAETVAPRIGIEFFADPGHDSQRQTLVHQCIAEGLCTPEQGRALCAWPGCSRVTYEGHSWPTLLKRWLCLKIVYQPDQTMEAKGYLGFMPDVYPLVEEKRRVPQEPSLPRCPGPGARAVL